MQCAVRKGPLLLLLLVVLAALHAPAVHARSLHGSRRRLLLGKTITIIVVFGMPSGMRAARAARFPHTNFGTRTATGPTTQREVVNNVFTMTGTMGDSGKIVFDPIPDPNFAGVSQQVTVDGTTVTYTQVLNTNTSAIFTNGSAADGTFLVPGSSFTSSFSVDGSHISVIGGKGSDLFLTNVLNGTGNDSFFQVYNPSNPGFPGIGGQPGFPGNPGGTNGLDGVLLFRLDRPWYMYDTANVTRGGVSDSFLQLTLSGSGPFNNSTDAGGVVQAVVPQVGCSEAPKIPGTIFYSVASRSIFNYDWQNFVQYVQYRTVDQGRQYIQRVTANQQPAQQVACDAATDSICIGKCLSGFSTGYSNSEKDTTAICYKTDVASTPVYNWLIRSPCVRSCDAGQATSGIPDGLNIDPNAACKLDVPIAHGQTCQLACLEGYVPDEKSGSQVLAQCDAGTLKYISGSCKAAECSSSPMDEFAVEYNKDPKSFGNQQPSGFKKGDTDCSSGQDGDVCLGSCYKFPGTDNSELLATCKRGKWRFSGSCPKQLPNDYQFLTTRLVINVNTITNTRANEIGGVLLNENNSVGPTIDSSSSNDLHVHDSIQSFLQRPDQQYTRINTDIPNINDFLTNQTGGKKRKLLEAGNRTVAVNVEVVERVDGAEWRASYGTMQPKALGPLQQLLSDLEKYGVTAVMPTFVANLKRLAGLTVDEAATLLALRQVNITTSSKQGSLCPAGTEAFAPEGTPCYLCQNESVSVDGGSCFPCSVVNSIANPDHTVCTCKYGYDPAVANGQLQMCMQWYLNCGAIANSEVNVIGTGCACTYGFKEQYDPATGKLLKCIPVDCSTIPGAELDAVGAGCACKQGFTQKDTADGSLACVSETHPAADDAVTATAGTWLSIPVLDNDPGSPTRIKSVGDPDLGGKAIITADAASGKDVIKYISRTPAVAGTETFKYMTELGVATVSVTLTPGACSEDNCGVQQLQTLARGQGGKTPAVAASTLPGTCQAGSCVCVPGSGMTPVFVKNPSAADVASTPQVPACRYKFFTAVDNFTTPGKIVDVDASGKEASLSFKLDKDGTECLSDIEPVIGLGVSRLPSCPTKKRSSTLALSAVLPKLAVDVSLTCGKGVYSIAVPVPNGVGSCYGVALRLADGTIKRAVVRDIGP